jgi:hypothetical protein
MRLTFTAATAGLAICLWAASPAAAQTTAAELKADIEGLLQKLETSTHGFVKWDGADRMDIRQEGDAAVADIANPRLLFDATDPKPTRVTLDHIEIRRAPAPDDAIAWTVSLPAETVVRDAKGQPTKLTLKNAGVKAVVDKPSGRTREFALDFAGARVDDPKTGGWLSFGPLTLSSKLTGEPGGGWTAPIAFELKGIEFFFTEGPVGGAIERIAYNAKSSGPDLAALNRLRARMEAIQQDENTPAADRLNALLDLLPGLPSLFTKAQGELSIERMAARTPTGEPIVGFEKASAGGALTGLSGSAAALRITLRQDGLNLGTGMLDKDKVPRHVVFDFGLEEVDTGVLLNILETVAKVRLGGSDAERQRGQQQLLGAVAKLNPVLRVYDLAVDTQAVGVEARAEARGSPLNPKGYKADADIAVRGFDELAVLLPAAALTAYLPLLKELGTASAGAGSAPKIAFHLASAPPKWLTLNGQDISAWLTPEPSGDARRLRPAEPALTGADVRAVQRALAAAQFAAPPTGVYDAATAVAVARFQKQNGLNVDGVVDAETRRKLGVKPEPPTPAGPRTRPN